MIAGCVTGVVVGTRLGWFLLTAYVIRALDRRVSQRARRVGWRQRLAGGWAGFRGAVSFAAALAVPVTVGSGAPFPDRDLIVFTTALVILATILVQGTTLPAVMRWAGLQQPDTAREAELQLARTRASERGLAALPQVAAELGVDGELLERVRAEYEEHAAAIRAEGEAEEATEAANARELSRQLRLGCSTTSAGPSPTCATATR